MGVHRYTIDTRDTRLQLKSDVFGCSANYSVSCDINLNVNLIGLRITMEVSLYVYINNRDPKFS